MKTTRYTFNYIDHCNMCDCVEHSVMGKRLNSSQGLFPQKKKGITTTIVKCKKCNLIFSNPFPVPFDIQDHYGIPPEDYWKAEYFEIHPDYFGDEIKTFTRLNGIFKDTKALDIGAGLGKCMIAMQNAGIDAYGLEPSVHFYKRAIENFKISTEKLKLSTIEDVEYDQNMFDFITFGAVLEHLYDPSESIKKAIEWLKPGGLIHIEVPSSKWLTNKLINFSYKIRGLDYVGNISPMHSPFHLYEFDLKSFEINGKKNNYSIVHHQYYVCESYMPKPIDLMIRPIMKWTNSGMQLVVWLQKK